MMKKCTVIVFFILGIYSISEGQIERKKNSVFRVDRTELGLGAGTTFYLGDFNEFTPFMSPRYYGTVMHRYYFNLLYALRTSISFGNIAGNSKGYSGDMPFYDIKYPYGRPPVYFSRTLIDFNTGIELGFAPFEPVYHKLNERFAPYLFIGIGITIAYPDSYAKTDDARSASLLHKSVYGTVDANSSAIQVFNIPIGIGFKYSPWTRWTVGAEWQFKKTFNDDIDRFNNIRPSELNNSQKGSILMNTDWVSFFGVSISYRLAVRSKCPSLKRLLPSKRFFNGINRNYDLYDNVSRKKK
ncbi:MAG: DUF6089 family protein [Prevotellaceae bacterium]|jgi:opacity protein-like surface antigen|nr:DUF6089 family protein [Prevotellaceae bacterium]